MGDVDQHLCGINPRFDPYFSMLFRWIYQFICIPNGTIAEPDYHGRPTKLKKGTDGKSFPGCKGTIELDD